MTLVWDQA